MQNSIKMQKFWIKDAEKDAKNQIRVAKSTKFHLNMQKDAKIASMMRRKKQN
jgi:hypothetical protein